MKINGNAYEIYFRITKVRNRQAVKLPAVQPVVMATGHWPARKGNEKNKF